MMVDAAEQRVEEEREAQYPRAKFGSTRDVVDAIRAVMGWNTMYDQRATVITYDPVCDPESRLSFPNCILMRYFQFPGVISHTHSVKYCECGSAQTSSRTTPWSALYVITYDALECTTFQVPFPHFQRATHL